MTLIAILDDYTNVAKGSAEWAKLGNVTIDRVNTSLMRNQTERVAALKPHDVIIAIRERTAFSAKVLRELDQLRLLVTTGMRNSSIDMVAARAAGIDVSGTKMAPMSPGPVAVSFRPGCSFGRPFVRKPKGFSSLKSSVCVAGYRSL